MNEEGDLKLRNTIKGDVIRDCQMLMNGVNQFSAFTDISLDGKEAEAIRMMKYQLHIIDQRISVYQQYMEANAYANRKGN